MNEADGPKAKSATAKEFVFAIENVVKDVSLSQRGCDFGEDGLVMIDSGASVICLSQVVREIDTSEIRRVHSTPRLKVCDVFDAID